MGTRARINVIEGGAILVSIYRQYDGYPEGLGREVAQFLCGLTLVNGMGADKSSIANGMGCVAAQLIKTLKTEAGNVYIRDTGAHSQGEEYVYNVYAAGTEIWIAAYGGSMTAFGMPGDEESEMVTIFNGSPYEFLKFLKKTRKAS